MKAAPLNFIIYMRKSAGVLLPAVVNIQRKEKAADTTDTAQDRRSGVSATDNSIHEIWKMSTLLGKIVAGVGNAT